MPVHITITDGICQGGIHDVGQIYTVEETTPEGICIGAWNAIAPYLAALNNGANFSWEKEDGVATIHCPDPGGITLELRRIDE